jgi:regulatory protein
MTILSVKEGAGSNTGDPVIRIGLSDGSLFSFKPAYLAPPGGEFSPGEGPWGEGSGGKGPWEPGRELLPGEEGALRFAAACYRAEKLALGLLARAEQNLRSLGRKLALRRQDRAAVRAVLARLEGLGVLDDRRYAGGWLRARLNRRGTSPRILEAGLRARGIDRDTAATALRETLDLEGELLMLENYLEKKGLGSDLSLPSLKYRLRGEGFSRAALDRYREERE